jgi:hypothetical protein
MHLDINISELNMFWLLSSLSSRNYGYTSRSVDTVWVVQALRVLYSSSSYES